MSSSANNNSIAMTDKPGSKRRINLSVEVPRKASWKSCLTKKRLKKWLYPQESIDDLRNPVFYRDVFVEGVVSAYVMATVIWALMTLIPAAYSPNTTHFGIFAGFIIMMLIEGYGPISGAPLNPAGCWGFFLAGRISLARTILYTIVEVGGCAAGSVAAFYLSPEANQKTFGALKPGPGLKPVHGMFIEAILTFNLLFVALICTDPKRRTAVMPSFPIAWCIGTGILAAGTHTGGLQNPIVPLGPAIVSKDFENHWLYWAGPYLGATFGSLFYTSVVSFKDYFEKRLPPPNEEHPGIDNPTHTGFNDTDGGGHVFTENYGHTGFNEADGVGHVIHRNTTGFNDTDGGGYVNHGHTEFNDTDAPL